jgi:hypothetical protein
MPQDLAAGSFKYTVQPTEADLQKMNRIGKRVARYHNMGANKKLFMYSGAKPNQMMPRAGKAAAAALDTRSKQKDVLAAGTSTSYKTSK